MARTVAKVVTGIEALDDAGAGRGTRWFFQPGNYAKQRGEFAADESAPTKAAIDDDARETPKKG